MEIKMAKREFTAEQSSAINTRDKTLLVSAAAGSGKTATLVERIISSLLDSERPADISEMLIVTFTRAAVAELRERIGAALKEKLREEPDNARLQMQLYKLPSARICTIDSYCNEILKNNTERFGISPSYRTLDAVEAKLLSRSVLTALIDAACAGELSDVCSAEEFEELAFALVGAKSDSELEGHLLYLYEKTSSLIGGVDIFGDFARLYADSASAPIEENRFTAYAIKSLRELARHYTVVYLSYTNRLDPDSKAEGAYISLLSNELTLLKALSHTDSYARLRELTENISFKNAPQNSDGIPIITEIQKMRSAMKKELSAMLDKFFSFDEWEWRECFLRLSLTVGVLHRFLSAFKSALFEEKRRRAVLEYHDIERLAYESLYENGEPSELAGSIRNQFSAIYVDEYQDVNALQGSIFDAIAKPDNRFMVGDIKQSIYGFRSAKPDIFASMKKRFPSLSESEASPAASIFMSKNFRCDRAIIDFVNSIFDCMFSVAGESIDYVSEDRLVFAKLGEEPECREPIIRLFGKAAAFDLQDSDETEAQEAQTEANDLPPIWTAKKIKQLLTEGNLNDGSPIRPSDIAIILRKNMGRAEAYAGALRKEGVAVRVPDDKDFFNSPEIQLMLCLLNAINNPMRDIYLAGVMCSPLFGFTADELYFIKNTAYSDSLWNALLLYSEREHFEKGLRFINELNRYRLISEGMPTDALIMRLYRETGMLALAAKGGKRENLMLLYNYARRFESASFEGLYSFISYVNTVIENNTSFENKKESADEDAVTVITVHSSKGLEYPIVFLGDVGSSLISQADRRARIAYSEDFGAAMRLRRKGGIALLESPVFNTVLDYSFKKTLEEELRVYYVALTRAREQLYITGCVEKNDVSEYLDIIRTKKTSLTSYTLSQMKTFVDIMLVSEPKGRLVLSDELIPSEGEPSNEVSGSESADFNSLTAPVSNFETSSDADLHEPIHCEGDCESESITDILLKRWNFVYPDKYMTELPTKMSVSRLYPTVLDGSDTDEITPKLISDAEEASDALLPPSRREYAPRFVSGAAADESAKRGIATHLVLQFCDFAALAERGSEAELSRLYADGFISKDDLSRVRIDEIDLFIKSELYREIIGARQLYREFRFNVMLPASLFTTEPERKAAYEGKKILLQGVIDCLIEDSDGNLHLIDYKTDRLTRAELADRQLAERKLSKKHSLQLSYYALAIKEIFGKEPETRRVYSLPLGDTVEV